MPGFTPSCGALRALVEQPAQEPFFYLAGHSLETVETFNHAEIDPVSQQPRRQRFRGKPGYTSWNVVGEAAASEVLGAGLRGNGLRWARWWQAWAVLTVWTAQPAIAKSARTRNADLLATSEIPRRLDRAFQRRN
jgi:hypothetical protein